MILTFIHNIWYTSKNHAHQGVYMEYAAGTDFDLLLLYKETEDDEILCEMFERYKPLIGRIHRLYFSKYKYEMPIEDFEQEAFILLCKAMDYANIEIITDPFHWKFYTIFSMYLTNYSRYTLRTIGSKLSSIKIMSEDEFDSLSVSYVVEFPLYIEEFMKKLSSLQKKIFYHKFLSHTNPTYAEVSELVNSGKAWTARIGKRLMEDFQQEYV